MLVEYRAYDSRRGSSHSYSQWTVGIVYRVNFEDKNLYTGWYNFDKDCLASGKTLENMLIEAYGVRELELDFEKTEFMDSSGIGVIIGRSKTMKFRGGKLSVAHIGKRVEMIFQSAGLAKIVEIKREEE